jgi:amidase
VDLAIGSDQRGSVPIPSCWSGIYGLKRTLGLVPYNGAFPIQASLDHLGPMARSTHDVALLLQTIPGTDMLDPRQHGASAAPTTWDPRRRSRRAAACRGARGLRAAHAFETEIWSPPPP